MISLIPSRSYLEVFRRTSSTVPSSPGQAGASTVWPFDSKRCFQPSQLSGVSQRPWIRTMAGFRAAGAGAGVSVVMGLRPGRVRVLTRDYAADPLSADLRDALDHIQRKRAETA